MTTFFWHVGFYTSLFLTVLVGVWALLEWLKGKK